MGKKTIFDLNKQLVKDAINEDHDLQDKVNQLVIERGIENGIKGWFRTVCITGTCAMGSFFLWLGNIVYEKWPAFKGAIMAFIDIDSRLK